MIGTNGESPVEPRGTVARMAKVRSWHDVRLLSFDLQTVEFAYAAVCSLHVFGARGGLMNYPSPTPCPLPPSTSFQPREARIVYGSHVVTVMMEITLMETRNPFSKISFVLANCSLPSIALSLSFGTHYL